MIPKIIHYCWFGCNPKPKSAEKCIKSWKRKCPDYEIIEWNDGNFDITSCPLYVRQAYDNKKWAFVTDYVRLKVVYDNGGIYLDTDVELIKKLDFLLENKAYFGFEDGVHIATGLGFGAEKEAPILKNLMEDYNDIPFILDNGEFDRTPCPKRNTIVFKKHGLIQDDSMQVLDNSVLILPSVYLCPISYATGELTKSKNTVSIHRFEASWKTAEENKKRKTVLKEQAHNKKVDIVKHIPNRVLLAILGEDKYDRLKAIIKH